MGKALNVWSFYSSIICFLLVLFVSTTSIKKRVINLIGIHPLEILFYLSIIIFITGLIGFSAVYNWKAAIRGIFTVSFSLVITVFLAYIIFVGRLME